MSHVNDPAIRDRLRRASGHLATVVRMIEEERDCLAIAQQLQAVLKAIEKVKTMVIHDHLENHLGAAAIASPEAKRLLDDFREISKYL
ncbi:metal-sensing transcriptional repressor [Prosthecomicrobium pneumaticum]|uniref:Nickel resistance protein n=1 Tax=Prosthecomicrobium pneumaticum TaxID=81895 RepID=A0A7W9FL35_9HYPH|nr:metal-sensing transcriptional repressor [Prosthecomicrobium pneumaticum]MBB5752084.1 hypothetical protein NreA [Prosthecomicrobium pneumaticum]